MLLLKFSLLSYLSNFLQKKEHAFACSFFYLYEKVVSLLSLKLHQSAPQNAKFEYYGFYP